MTGTGLLRVTLVVNSTDGVSETFLRSLADLLSDIGHHVTVLSLRGAPNGGGPAPQQIRLLIGALRALRGRPGSIRAVLSAAVARFGWSDRAVRAVIGALPMLASDPDVVHFGFSGIAVNLADSRELLGDCLVVISCRGTGEQVRPILDPERAPGLRNALQRADAIHAVSESVARSVIDMGASADRVTVIRPAVDAAIFLRSDRSMRPAGPLRLVTVARLHWVKGLGDLLDAVALVRADGNDVTLTIVGDGPDAEGLRFRSWALGLGEVVTFVGAVPPEQVRSIVESSDVFVLSSLSEGVSNSVLEAMALGLAVISTEVGGMGEVIVDGEHGLLVPPGDPTAIAAAVVRLRGDPDLAARLAQSGQKQVDLEYTLERQRRELEALYRGLVDGDQSMAHRHPRGTGPISTTE